jgi:hypothetical protein
MVINVPSLNNKDGKMMEQVEVEGKRKKLDGNEFGWIELELGMSG